MNHPVQIRLTIGQANRVAFYGEMIGEQKPDYDGLW